MMRRLGILLPKMEPITKMNLLSSYLGPMDKNKKLDVCLLFAVICSFSAFGVKSFLGIVCCFL